MSAIYELTLEQFLIRKVLVIAPLRVASMTWPDEIEKWDNLNGLTYALVIGNEHQRKAALLKKAQVYIINRENTDWLITKSGIPFDFDMVVIDELSSFKAYSSKRFKALRKVRPSISRIVGLTGTPASNGLIDLWAEIGILDMGQRLGRYITQFRNTYFEPDKRNQNIIFSYKPKHGAEEAIYNLISDITISMKNTDYINMPELLMNDISVKLFDDEKQYYLTMKKEMVLSIKDKEIDAINVAALSNKLLQMANGAVYDENRGVVHIHDRKIDALEDIIEASNGKLVLIVYWFKHDLERIVNRFHAVQLISQDSVKRWNRGDIPVAIIHPLSAGHGLNLQAGGSTLVWFGLTWSLELYQQTNARIWRQGQKNTVVIHHIIAKDTIDEDVIKALRKKEITQTALIDAVKANLKELIIC